MPNIPTLTEARDAIDTLRRFVDGLEATFGAIRSPSHPIVPQGQASKAPVEEREPSTTWPDRVRVILRDANRPLEPKDIIEEYRKRQWVGGSLPDDLGNRIRSVLWQLKRRGELNHDARTGRYRLTKASQLIDLAKSVETGEAVENQPERRSGP